MPLPLAALPAILGGAQTLGGLIGRATRKRPKYNIPTSITNAVEIAKLRAQGNMPGFSQAQGNLSLMAANALAGARESGFAGENVQAIAGQTNRGLNELAAQNAQFRDRAQQQYQQQLGVLGQYQDQQFQTEFDRFRDQANLYEDMFGAGVQNLFNAFTMGNSNSSQLATPTSPNAGFQPSPTLPKAQFSQLPSSLGDITQVAPNAGFTASPQLPGLQPGLLPSRTPEISLAGGANPAKITPGILNSLKSLYIGL